MTLFELQAWLGHRSPESTQHYAKISPNTLTKAYEGAGHFARNVRTIEVLVDHEAVVTGSNLLLQLALEPDVHASTSFHDRPRRTS